MVIFHKGYWVRQQNKEADAAVMSL